MSRFGVKTKKRLVFILIIVSLIFSLLIARIGYLLLVKGDWLKEKAIAQQTRDIPIEPKRGTIYDRKGKELAVSITKSTVWAKPSEIKDKKIVAKELSMILEEEEDEIYKKISKKVALVKVKRWIEDDKASQIRKLKMKGIWIAEDNKRYYPYGNFAAHILGHVSSDNEGVSGLELRHNKELKGFSGRLVISTDASGREIPRGSEKYHEPKDGSGMVLTVDETIQHYAEKAADKALIINKAKRVHVIVMQPKTGDILAMVSKPDYDPNNYRTPIYKSFEEELNKYSEKDKIKGWFKMWRNPIVNDTYEPGSTFKLITSAAGLEEGVVTPEDEFYDKGFIMVGGRRIKCWRHYRPHGHETFTEAVQNSCNPVFVEVGQRLGVKNLYKYIKAFGLTSKTGIDLPGEENGLMYNEKNVGPVELATISFGQSISVTPIQLITAISCIANDGKLMKPRIVKEFIDNKGNVVKSIEPEMVRRVISQETSRTLRGIMESVVAEGSGKKAYIEGYHVGGKTGTAQKVIDGRYAKGRYITSFVGIAPASKPEVAVIAIVDEPNGDTQFGSTTAGPIIKEVIYNTLKYLEIKPDYTEEEKIDFVKKEISVPEVRNIKLKDAGKILEEKNFKFTVEPNIYATGEEKVIDVFPKPGVKVFEESNIILYTKPNNKGNENIIKVVVPDLTGKTVKECDDILKKLGLKLKPIGSGLAVSQDKQPNTELNVNSIITVEFK
ncbi:stage V sporulation protein D [Tepidibacter hydrothermalis]|uniref:Stage V sporulation protein D n=1 Tax=Tepidibacter hydrothermalis TaxID=3036126 RepID=A0ABY8E8G1_9FIRM|nr:stage V sporulation protein D [Tepidibacter hydrothermalis]WFD09157.1 stage V sporulation protein D [Tepidibacter hydrothermalis]